MNVFTVLGIAVLAACAGMLLRQYSPSLALCVVIGAGCLLLLGCVEDCMVVATEMKNLLSKAQIESTFFGILLKTLGICYICQFAGDLCKDAGETALAGYVELVGKITVAGLSLPLIGKVVETVVKLIEA